MSRVSVIVPVFEAPDEHVRSCLWALLSQDYPSDEYEIIVIDDGSKTRKISEQVHRLFSAKADRLICVSIPHSGTAVARNAGLEIATGDFVAFTDIDCIPSRDWLRRFVEGLQDTGLDAAGGKTISHRTATVIERYCDYFASLRTPVFRNGITFLIGANCCWRMTTLRCLGGFSSAYACYASCGITLNGFEDFELSWRAANKRARLGYLPSAVVKHRHRSTLAQRTRQFRGYGRGYGFLQHLLVDRPVLSRYHVAYPASRAIVISQAVIEASLLAQRVSSPDLWGLNLGHRVLYAAFDYIQRLAFLSGYADISRKLKKLTPRIQTALQTADKCDTNAITFAWRTTHCEPNV